MPKSAALEYKKALRNICNAALCIGEWSNIELENAARRPTDINWGHVGSAAKSLEDLREICRFLNIELKEV